MFYTNTRSYTTPKCISTVSENGFVAGRYARTVLAPPPVPKASEPEYWQADIGQHMNRKYSCCNCSHFIGSLTPAGNPVHSPWISTANNLSWIIRLAVKESMEGVAGGKISVIDTSVSRFLRSARSILTRNRPLIVNPSFMHAHSTTLCAVNFHSTRVRGDTAVPMSKVHLLFPPCALHTDHLSGSWYMIVSRRMLSSIPSR